MNILVAGGSGFIGQGWIAAQKNREHHITVLGRDQQHMERIFQDHRRFPTGLHYMTWGKWLSQGAQALEPFDIVINLCGENIAAKRWGQQRKHTLLQSRIKPTHNLVQHILQCQSPPHLLNASGVGIYGLQTAVSDFQPVFTEQSAIHPDHSFLQQLSRKWEAQSLPLLQTGGVTLLRFAPVMDPRGGVLARLLPLFRARLGGPAGSGFQPFPWVTLDDAVSAIDFIIQHQLKGPINIVAPHIIQQKQFAKALGLALQKPFEFRSPAWLLKCLFGQMADELLLHGQQVMPEKLKTAGFHFLYDTVELALNGIVHRQ